MTSAVDLSGKLAVITGAGSGIGAACAHRLASAGASVVVVDLREDAAKAVADEVGGTYVAADLSTPDFDADGIAGEADILVNNAGIQHVAPIHEFPLDRFRLIQTLMVEAPFRLTRAALPHMYAAGWGRIVHISSVHGLRASAFKSAYVTAKHAIEGLSKVTALEGGPHGVTSNTVCPGYVRTPLVENQIAEQARVHGIPADEVVSDVMLASSVIKRLIEPAEIADLVAFLCSPAASVATGTSWVMDGGWTAH